MYDGTIYGGNPQNCASLVLYCADIITQDRYVDLGEALRKVADLPVVEHPQPRDLALVYRGDDLFHMALVTHVDPLRFFHRVGTSTSLEMGVTLDQVLEQFSGRVEYRMSPNNSV